MIAQCKDEKCDGSRAYFYQLQIRSADEPMTTFFRVSGWLRKKKVLRFLDQHADGWMDIVYHVRGQME